MFIDIVVYFFQNSYIVNVYQRKTPIRFAVSEWPSHPYLYYQKHTQCQNKIKRLYYADYEENVIEIVARAGMSVHTPEDTKQAELVEFTPPSWLEAEK